MASIPTFSLNTGAPIPALGLGIWAGLDRTEREASKAWILTALQAGYRHFDTAYLYGTEHALGEAIRESGVPRAEIFVTTKLPWNHHGRVHASFQESLANLGLDYVDLYLMHWPQAIAYDETTPLPRNADGSLKLSDTPFTASWAEMEKIHKTGAARAIGVSNFSLKTFEVLLKSATVVPAVNQIEMHPYLAQNELLRYHREKGILTTAYTPTGYATVRGDATIGAIAARLGATPTQVILAWHLARGVVAVPKSADAARQKENITIPAVGPEDLALIDALDRGERLCNKADERGTVWGWTYEQLGW